MHAGGAIQPYGNAASDGNLQQLQQQHHQHPLLVNISNPDFQQFLHKFNQEQQQLMQTANGHSHGHGTASASGTEATALSPVAASTAAGKPGSSSSKRKRQRQNRQNQINAISSGEPSTAGAAGSAQQQSRRQAEWPETTGNPFDTRREGTVQGMCEYLRNFQIKSTLTEGNTEHI